MNMWRINRLLLFVLFWASALSPSLAAGDLQKDFLNPPAAAKPWVYWINMDGHFTKEGITADLESMKSAGIGGMIHMDVDVGVPRGNVAFMSETWQDNFKHAALECERLGLELTTITGPGWTGTGGPWVEAEQSMQHLVPVSVNVKGPSSFNQILPKPQPRVSPYHTTQTPQMRSALADFYEDVAVYAFPRCEPVIGDINEKAFFIRDPYTSKPGVSTHLPSPTSYPALEGSKVIDPKTVIDLTARLQADGRLEWEVPLGEWTILRMGRRSSGANTRPAPAAGLGFESNKFDKKALESHFKAYFDPLLERIGPRPKERTTGFTGMDADSWEMSSQNWTPGFREMFKKLRGYDPWPYFPVYSGCVVGSREISERFLWDVRMTCQELLLDNHIAHMKTLCHARGLKLAIEPYDMTPVNDLDLGSYADIPMGEFWHNHFNSAWSCIEASSIGHVLGKSVVAAEAFTAVQTHWKTSPWTLKNQSDWAFAIGINRFVIVSFAHQPRLDRVPGMMFSNYGLQWERTQTFWPLVGAYHQYLARCSHLLQQGVAVSDILYLTPEGAPHVFRAPDSALNDARGWRPDKKGYGFDACSPRMLLERAKVKDGQITLGGSAYRMLVLPRFDTMTPELLDRLIALVKAGATVYGAPPLASPSLSNYPECDTQVKALAEKLWTATPKAERRLGKGRVILDAEAQPGKESGVNRPLYPDYTSTVAVLKGMGLPEDFVSDGPLRYGHRRTTDEEIYFIANTTDKSVEASCVFRVTQGAPQLWDPLTAATKALPEFAQQEKTTTIPLRFEPHQSFFVVFKKGKQDLGLGTRDLGKKNFPERKLVQDLAGAWEVQFDPKWGGPEKPVIFNTLADWTDQSDPGIKFYSGTATYRKSFDWSHPGLSSDLRPPISLSLGVVHNIARVRLNGKDLGVIWCAPWRVDISSALQPGANNLEIEVVNLWPNRLIGDAAKSEAERLTWTVIKTPYTVKSALLPSGLLGPVTLQKAVVE
jgi:hypothetical protein